MLLAWFHTLLCILNRMGLPECPFSLQTFPKTVMKIICNAKMYTFLYDTEI